MSAAVPFTPHHSDPAHRDLHDTRDVQGHAGQQSSTATRIPSTLRMTPRLATLRQFANAALDQDRLTMFPLALGELSDDERNLVLDNYLQAADATHFEPLAPNMVMPNGWQTLLGPNLTMLLIALRRLQCIDYRTGAYRPWVTISLPELARCVGVDPDTISRWVCRMRELPALESVLGDYKKQQEALDVLGRRKKPALTDFRLAMLRLFVPETKRERRPSPAGDGSKWGWLLSFKVLPWNPLTLQEERVLLARLQEAGLITLDVSEEDEVITAPETANKETAGSDANLDNRVAIGDDGDTKAGQHSNSLDNLDAETVLQLQAGSVGAVFPEDHPSHLNDELHVTDVSSPQQRQNVAEGVQPCAPPATTKCRRSGSDCQNQTEPDLSGGSAAEPPHPLVKVNATETAKLVGTLDGASKRRQAESHRRVSRQRTRRRCKVLKAYSDGRNLHRSRRIANGRTSMELGQQVAPQTPPISVTAIAPTPTPTGVMQTTCARNAAHWTPDEQAAWYTTHDRDIKRFSQVVAPYIRDFRALNDAHHASTVTRAARLFAGAQPAGLEVSPEQVDLVRDLLYQAYDRARSGRGSHLVRHEGATFYRAPKFCRELQTLLGGEKNPAYLPLRKSCGHHAHEGRHAHDSHPTSRSEWRSESACESSARSPRPAQREVARWSA